MMQQPRLTTHRHELAYNHHRRGCCQFRGTDESNTGALYHYHKLTKQRCGIVVNVPNVRLLRQCRGSRRQAARAVQQR